MMKATYKRIILIICTSALLISTFLFPAAATSVDSVDNWANVNPDIYDLLTDDVYYATGFSDGTEYNNTEIKYPSVTLAGTRVFEIWWGMNNIDDGLHYVVFTLQTRRKPDRVSLKLWDGGYRDAPLVGSNGDLFLYRVPMYEGQVGILGVKAEWATNYDGIFTVRSMRGYYNNAAMVTYASYRMTATVLTQNAELRQIIYDYGSGVSMPVIGEAWKYNDVDNLMQTGKLYIWLSKERRIYQELDKLTFFFTTPDPEATVGVCTVNGNNSILDIAPVTVTQTASSKVIYYDNEWPVYTYRVDCDFSNIVLSTASIQIEISADNIIANTAWDKVVFIEFDACYVSPPLDDIPWYKMFFNWISFVMKSGYQSIVDALSGNSSQQGAADKFEQEVSDVNQQLQNASDQMDQIEYPEVNMSDIIPSNILQGSHYLTYIDSINNFWDCPEIALIMVVLGGMIFISYLLFGEKG